MAAVGSEKRVFTLHIRSADKVTGITNSNYAVNVQGVSLLDETGKAPKFYRMSIDALAPVYSGATYAMSTDTTGFYQVCLGFAGTPYKYTSSASTPATFIVQVDFNNRQMPDVSNVKPIVITGGAIHNMISVRILNDTGAEAGGTHNHVIVLSLTPIWD